MANWTLFISFKKSKMYFNCKNINHEEGIINERNIYPLSKIVKNSD